MMGWKSLVKSSLSELLNRLETPSIGDLSFRQPKQSMWISMVVKVGRTVEGGGSHDIQPVQAETSFYDPRSLLAGNGRRPVSE